MRGKTVAILALFVLIMAQSALAFGAVEATFLSQDPDPVEPGEYIELRWRIENEASEDIDNIEISIQEEFPFEFDSEADRVKRIDRLSADLEGEKSVVLKFRARINENAVTGDEEIELRIRFPGEKEQIEKQDISIQSRDVLLAVEEVNLVPERPRPGETVKVELTLLNLEGVTAEDIQVKFDLEGTSVATLGGTSEQYVKELKRGERTTLNFSLGIGADVESKLYQIPVRVRYSDKFGRTFNFSSSFGCAVEAPPEYIVNIRDSDIVTPNSQGKLILSMSNVGASDINYVSMEVMESENLELLSNPVMYMGNLESDDYETAEYDVYVREDTGDVPLKVKLTYKDSYNRNVEEEVDLNLKIYSEDDAIAYGLKAAPSYTGVILLLLFAGGIAYWILRKRK